MKRKILITNDDGISSPGIIRLAKEAIKFGDVWVVAPKTERSAASHSITLRDPIDAIEYDFPIPGVKSYAVSGTPADCVRVGTLNIVPNKPDIILSGINNGFNAGTDVQYSATVGAAMEGAFQGIPSIALSEKYGGADEIVDAYLYDVIDELIDSRMGNREIINVNFPRCKLSDLNGILRNRKNSSSSVFKDVYEEKPIDGGIRFFVNGLDEAKAEEGSDLHALYNNYISIGFIKNLQ